MPTRMRMRTAILVFGFWFLVGCFVLPALTFVLVSDLPFLVDPSHGLFALQLRAHTIPSFRPQRLSRFVCPFPRSSFNAHCDKERASANRPIDIPPSTHSLFVHSFLSCLTTGQDMKKTNRLDALTLMPYTREINEQKNKKKIKKNLLHNLKGSSDTLLQS